MSEGKVNSASKSQRSFSWLKRSPLAISLIAVVACTTPEIELCRSQYLQLNARLPHVDQTSLEELAKALDEVEEVRLSCTRAEQPGELAQLNKHRAHLEGSQLVMERRNAIHLSDEELSQFQKSGDPACPTGQSYKLPSKEFDIKCSGPQVLDMNLEQATQYFKRRRYKIHNESSALKAEYGSESFVFNFKDPKKPAPCLIVYAGMQKSWQEVASFVAGVNPHTLKSPSTLKSSRGPQALRVEGETDRPILKIGQCPQ